MSNEQTNKQNLTHQIFKTKKKFTKKRGEKKIHTSHFHFVFCFLFLFR